MCHMLLRISELCTKRGEIDLKPQLGPLTCGPDRSMENATFSYLRREKRSQLAQNRRKTLQLFSINLFQKTPVLSGFSRIADNFDDAEPRTQLKTFNLCWDSTDLKFENASAFALAVAFVGAPARCARPTTSLQNQNSAHRRPRRCDNIRTSPTNVCILLPPSAHRAPTRKQYRIRKS
jgi:hypothetical protein